MYNLEWRLSNYSSYDLSSLEFAIYGGQGVPPEFLRRLAAMAPVCGTGLGLTESAGFCTYVTSTEVLAGVGHAMPVYPFTIRGEMREDGAAGDELPAGSIGHVCFRGPQTFLGYVGNPQATRDTVSSDGWLYTGDMGSYTDAAGLRLHGRHKWFDQGCRLSGLPRRCGGLPVHA